MQDIFSSYFENIEQCLSLEISKNKDQIFNYLHNPDQYLKSQKSLKSYDSTSQLALSYSEEKNMALNQKQR